MKKASNVLYMVGVLLTLLGLPVFTIIVITSFGIANPGYTQSIIDSINSGEVTYNIPGTTEEQAAWVQHYFLILGIIFLIFGIINVAKFVISIMAKRMVDNKTLHIIALVLGILSGGILIVLASIFALITLKQERDVEEISASI